MNPSDNEPDDTVVVDTTDLELPRRGSRLAKALADESERLRARGTREQAPLERHPEAYAARPPGARDVDRDPIDVLRAWPHSMGGREARTAASRAATTAPSAKPRAEDKITLAYLALDLYREVEQIQASSRRACSAEAEATVCTNRGCDVRISALRGALIEACLLVQRVVMTTPAGKADIEDRIRELLELMEE